MITSLLIANRGEIALRIMRTARQLGIRVVAIHTKQDVLAPHVGAADEAIGVPTYLDIQSIVAAAVAAEVDAVHPGYGFLSENADFAESLEAAQITLVGPSAAVIRKMGRKDLAREVAVAAGVPVIPEGTAQFPVLVKAASGGGGKGIRVVRTPEQLPEAMAAAKREAASAFGEDTLLVERYFEQSRHLEVQIMGDQHGQVIHLWERDCSPQRRHQKVLEEAPAPTVSDHTRHTITQAAVSLAASVGYVSAGTVEFLYHPETQNFYFLEMNTRLQVEHPVTEAITGLDLVELQLRVAAGEPLPIAQNEVPRLGHAIEARIYAEDPHQNFLPQAGCARTVLWPSELHTGKSQLRVDHALFSGQVVPTTFDPMLGKIIAWALDREAARQALVAALDATVVLGLPTNTGFLRGLVASTEYQTSAVHTSWLDHPDHQALPPDPAPARHLAAWALYSAEQQLSGPFAADGFRVGAPPAPIVVSLDEPVALRGTCPVLPPILIRPDQIEVVIRGERFCFDRPSAERPSGVHQENGTVVAPMPGTLLAVLVAPGDLVCVDQPLAILEAMKMELTLRAPLTGKVTTVAGGIGAGQQVGPGSLLFVIEGDSV
jgi:acetyl-CoA/propionyl-CoA carboxylase, biotin carboxylase, biotin carboxyl carrier protein